MEYRHIRRGGRQLTKIEDNEIVVVEFKLEWRKYVELLFKNERS